MDSTQLYGYAGRLLRIDLSEGKVIIEETKPEILRKFLGGVGYGAKLLYDEIPAGCIDPLSAENKLVFATGPLTSTLAPGSGFAEVCCKSPRTDVWGESPSNRSSWDRRARVEIIKEYAVADIDKARSTTRFLFSVSVEKYGDWGIKSLNILEWLRRHYVEESGQKWMQE